MLSVKGLGLAAGLLWAAVIAWCVGIVLIGKGTAPFDIINQLYLGWITPDLKGLIIGVFLGFIDGAIVGAIFAWLHNAFKREKTA